MQHKEVWATQDCDDHHLTSNGINLIFNYLLIHGNLGFPLSGSKGSALATILGSTVALPDVDSFDPAA